MKDDRLYLHHMLERCRRRPSAFRPSRARMPALDWKSICGMRDVLIHDYIGVDLDEVWHVASSRIPELQAVLEQFLAAEDPGAVPVS